MAKHGYVSDLSPAERREMGRSSKRMKRAARISTAKNVLTEHRDLFIAVGVIAVGGYFWVQHKKAAATAAPNATLIGSGPDIIISTAPGAIGCDCGTDF